MAFARARSRGIGRRWSAPRRRIPLSLESERTPRLVWWRWGAEWIPAYAGMTAGRNDG